MKRIFSLVILVLIGINGLNAQDLKDYKYIVVPQKFDFQDEAGEYDLNALTRFLFIKWGFDAYLENEEMPADLNASGCNTLYTRADVGGFLTTKATITLVNCKGQEVFKLPEGKSKIKEFKEGHQEAFRRAFEGLEELGYTYSDEIVERAEVSEETETLIPEARKTMPQKAETKTVKVSAVPKDGNTEVKEVLEVVEQNTPQAQIAYKGESEEYKKTNTELYLIFALALITAYLAMSAQFESWKHPFTIMLTVPMAILGGLLGLLVVGSSLNVYSQIALIILIGLSAKNGILIVEFANQLRKEGKNLEVAVFEAAAIRLRPILMTSLSTIIGVLPLILGTGPGAASRLTVGITIFGGMLFSTFFTLYVIPTIYTIVGKNTKRIDAVEIDLNKQLKK